MNYSQRKNTRKSENITFILIFPIDSIRYVVYGKYFICSQENQRTNFKDDFDEYWKSEHVETFNTTNFNGFLLLSYTINK
jgi:hypothetical protein